MKKVFIAIVTFLALSSSVMAAGHVDSVRYLNTKFGKNWFVTADATVNWWQGSDRNPNGNYTTLNGPSLGGSLSLGKWINHNFGVKLTYDVNQGKSYINNYYPRLDFTYLYDENPQPIDDNHYYNTHFMYHNLHADVMVSPVDFFQGYYNPNRIYTPVFFIGAGLACVSEHVFVTQSLINNESRNFEASADAGLINNFRLSNHFDLNLTLIASAQEWHIDSWYNEYGFYGDSPRPRVVDFNYSAQLGLTYYFSREYDLPNNCCEEMDIMRRKLDSLMNLPAPDPVHDTVVNFVNVQTEDIISYPFSIFFNRDSYELMSRRDLVNLREIAEVAKKNNFKIRLRGSADSATATPAYNQTLSENRCNKIKGELMSMGIPESQIILLPVGGVKELDPTEYDRRVLVELMQEAKQ